MWLLVILVLSSFAAGSSENVIQVNDKESSRTDGKTSIATASISVESDDLFNMSSIAWRSSGERTGTVFTKIRSSLTKRDGGSEDVVWRGALLDRVGFCTLYRSSAGTWSGSLTTDSHVYSLFTSSNKEVVVRAVAWKDIPDEAEPEEEDQGSQADPEEEPLETNIELSASSIVTFANVGESVESEGSAAAIFSANRRLDEHQNLRNLQIGCPVVDVLVVVTNQAMCEYAGLSAGCPDIPANRRPIEQQMPVLESQTNEAMRDTSACCQVRIARMIVMNSSGNGLFPSSAALNWIQNTGQVQTWRDDAGADLVALLTGSDPNNRACGIARMNAPPSTTSVFCLAALTFTHELGHNIGANHDRQNTENSHPYAYGYRVPGAFRTVMSYACTNGLAPCPRIPYYSNTVVKYEGQSMGNSQNNNARILTENARAVSNWKQAPLVPVESACPDQESSCRSGTSLLSGGLILGLLGQCFERCISDRSGFWLKLLGWKCGSC
jgi:hypothetical protein